MFDIEEVTVNSITKALETGEITSYELVREYQIRIAKYDKSGPTLNSIIELNPDALYIADAMDRERKNGKLRSPLHGVPILLKDSINTFDKMRTSAGSLALGDNYAPYDASIVTKMRDAGIIIMGKTNMTELANFMSYTMKNGYSSRGGQVINPYNYEGDTWGSSSGSAVAMAANLCALSIGTETDGSIIWPAHNNSIVGIKPTRGLISRHGIVPICTAQDTAGPMTRTVADAAALLNIIAGYDEHDPSTWAREDDIPNDYTEFLDINGLKNIKIGINLGYSEEFNTEQIKIAEQAFTSLKECGALLTYECNLPHLRCDSNVLLYEFKQCLGAYLSTCSPTIKCKSLLDIINFNNSNQDVALKYGQTILLDAQFNTSGTLTEPIYINSRHDALRISGEEGLLKVMNDNDVDILVSPGISDASPISGYPSIVVPAGYTSDNMPFGITFTGKPFSEPILIKAAYAFEQFTNARKSPKLD